ncbi:hypothetical protein MOO44_08605 [Nicoliella spurrieriana]|uniref:ApeA N-terminal domain-containing protein n=1 Tax=Nicoliella spurrieriana TaxID=2925830 RepID=A0A976X5F9_9LACO|nr:hypothetical protein [Nicoliella spurrieriana]UQS86908.1 hypothetical protein MOO44_08605 [Nicoliella spurrieriana]
MNFEDITSYDDFIITGIWGTSENNLKTTGSLVYNSDGIRLYLNDFDHNDMDSESIFGRGSLVVQSGKYKDEQISVHEISLLSCHIFKSSISFKYNDEHMTNDLCISGKLFIGDCFVNNDTKYSKCILCPTNLSGWMKNDKYDSLFNEEAMDFKVLSEDNISDDTKIQLISISNYYENNELLERYHGIRKDTHISIISSLSIEDISRYINDLETFLSLSMNSNQAVIKCILINSYNNKISYFRPRDYNTAKPSSFINELHLNKRTDNFFNLFINGLKHFIENDDKLLTIGNSISYYNYNNLNMSLSRAFSGIDLISANYFKNEMNNMVFEKFGKKDDKKYPPFSIKAKSIINSFNRIGKCEVISVLENNNESRNEDIVCEKLNKIRNSVDHGSYDYGNDGVSIYEAYKYNIASRFIVRRWILSECKIPNEILDNVIMHEGVKSMIDNVDFIY